MENLEKNFKNFTFKSSNNDIFTGREFSFKGKDIFLPETFSTNNGEALITFTGKTPMIRFNTNDNFVILSPDGICFDGKEFLKHSKSNFKKLSSILRKDQKAQNAIITLRKRFSETFLEVVNFLNKQPHEHFFMAYKEMQDQLIGKGIFYENHDCRIETTTTLVTTTVETWVDKVVTAAEQVESCTRNCLANINLTTPICLAGCVLKGFVDIIVGTIKVVEVVYKEVINIVHHCIVDPVVNHIENSFLTIYGRVTGLKGVFDSTNVGFVSRVGGPNESDLVKTYSSFENLIRCLLNSKITVSELKDLGIQIDGIKEVPFGVRLCVDRACADELKNTLSNIPGPLVMGLALSVFSGEFTSVISLLGLTALVEAAALALGISIAMLAKIIGACLLVLVFHAGIILGQIFLHEMFGQIQNGICLDYPLLPAFLGGVINPLIGLTILLNTVVIVNPY